MSSSFSPFLPPPPLNFVVLAPVSVKADLDLVTLLPGFLNAANTHFPSLVYSYSPGVGFLLLLPIIYKCDTGMCACVPACARVRVCVSVPLVITFLFCSPGRTSLLLLAASLRCHRHPSLMSDSGSWNDCLCRQECCL